MKVKVLTDFRDRANGLVTRKKDEVFEVSETRGEDLIRKKFIEKIKEIKPEAKAAEE